MATLSTYLHIAFAFNIFPDNVYLKRFAEMNFSANSKIKLTPMRFAGMMSNEYIPFATRKIS